MLSIYGFFVFPVPRGAGNFRFMEGKYFMEDYRIALVGIVVENADATEYLNLILHEYSAYIVGRMGIPYHDRGISIISVVMDAPQNIISALAGKLGQLHGVNVKTITQKAGTL